MTGTPPSCRCLVLLALALTAATVFAQTWSQQSALPTGWDLDGVTFLSETDGFVCGDDRVLMRTTDGGATWARVAGVDHDRDFYEQEMYDLAFADAQHGWAVGNVNFRTTDGGETWQEMASAGGNNEQIIPISADLAYLNSTWQLQKTTDGGVSWTPVYPETGIDRVNAMDWWDGDRGVFWGGGYEGTTSGLRLTLDGGDTWQLVRSGLVNDVTFVTSDVLLWHDHWGFRVFRSDDLGQTASVVLTVVDQPIEAIHRLPDGNLLVVDADVRMWLSEDGGLTWTQVRGKLGPGGQQSPGLHFRDAMNGWYVNNRGLMLQTNDGGHSWTQRQRGIGAILESVTMAADGRGVAVGHDGAVLVTDDFGGQWTLNPVLRDDGVAWDLVEVAQAGTGSRLFIASKPGLVYRSDDRGETWTTLANSPVFFNSIMMALDFVDEQTGYMFGRSYDFGLIYKTGDGGESWQTLMEAGDQEPLQLDAEMFDEDNGVSVGTGSSFFFTTDGWQTFTHRPITSAGVNWESIGFANLQVGWVGSFYGLVAHTTDGGLTWTDVVLPGIDSSFNIQAIEAKSEAEAYVLAAAPDEVRVYQTFDGGQTWQTSAPGIQGPDFYPTPTYNFFVSEAGDIWTVGYLGFMLARRHQPVRVGEPAPSALALHGNYPNPFNPATTIRFAVPSRQRVELAVYDLRGQRIRDLVGGVLPAGRHEVTWTGRDDRGRAVSSGTYFYRLTADGETLAAKMLLLK